MLAAFSENAKVRVNIAMVSSDEEYASTVRAIAAP
jgi:hypothetical protein